MIRTRHCRGLFIFSILQMTLGCASKQPVTREYTNTDRAQMMVDIANGALLDGDPTSALQNLANAEQLDPKLPQIYHSRALAFFRKNDLTSALHAARKAIELAPRYSDANNTLGRLLMEVGKSDEALTPLHLAANDSFYRDAYKAWTNLGILKYKKGEYIQAEAFLNRAILDSPQFACVAHYFRGQIEVQDTRVKDAIRDFHEATKRVCAHFADAHFALGLAYQKNRQYDEARKTFLEIQKLYPNTKDAERALAQVRYLP